MDDTIEDPVCGMEVSRDSFAMEHLGIHFAFCSQQCQDRFKANPHLFIGVPGKQAPKQKGLEIIKRRRFRLEQPLTDQEAAVLVKDRLKRASEKSGGCSEQDGQSVCSAALSITLRNVRQAIWKSRRIEGITRLRCVPTSWP
ncbi:YHS domain-containing protein [Thiobacillus sp.]|uniref:YHS domain-containing protein n=1 Tax=Thiobacillus sp. TaxID=924 RepID=UPI0025FF7F37|nr:YHS domain-containing protein [Thiobacillus sp.]